jgi:sortase A
MRKIMVLVVLLSMCVITHAQLALSDLLQRSGDILGQVYVPSIKLKQVMREGVDTSIINLGVAHWAGSAQSGQSGNMVLAGHRSTKTAPFFKIERVRIGDLVLVTNKDGMVARYRVYEMFIVDPVKGWSIIYPPDNPEDAILTIFTCHPLYSATQRFVVRARLSSP